MITKRIKKENWQRYFDNLSKAEKQSKVNIEINDETLGSQVQSLESKLLGISYDPHDQEIYIFMENETHAISDPIEIYAQQQGKSVQGLQIVDISNRRQLIKFNHSQTFPFSNSA